MGRNHPGRNHLGRTRNRGETTRIRYKWHRCLSADQNLESWRLIYCPITLTEISLNLTLNHKKQTYLSVTSVFVKVFPKNFSNHWSDQQDLQISLILM